MRIISWEPSNDDDIRRPDKTDRMQRTIVGVPKPKKVWNQFRARFNSSAIDLDKVERLVSLYDLGQIKSCSYPSIGASRSNSYIANTAHQKIFIKQYKESMTLEGITYEHSTLDYLSQKGFAAPKPVRCKNNFTIQRLDDRYYAIFDYLDGFIFNDYFFLKSKEFRYLKEAGRVLAKYHSLVGDFVPSGKKLDGIKPNGKTRWQDHEWHIKEYEKYQYFLKNLKNESKILFYIFNKLKVFRDIYSELIQMVEEKSGFLPQTIIHGDYGPHNILIKKDGSISILDFECVHLDLRATELMSSLWRFANINNKLNYDRVNLFSNGYRSISSIKPAEIKLLPHIFIYEQLKGIINHLRNYFTTKNKWRIDYTVRSIERIEWIEKNRTQLVQFLLNTNS